MKAHGVQQDGVQQDEVLRVIRAWLGCLITVPRRTAIRQPSQQQSWRQGGVWLAHRAVIKHVTYAYMYRVQHENLHAQGQSPDTLNPDVPFVALHLQQPA